MRMEKKYGSEVRILTAHLIQSLGAATAKARSPLCFNRDLGCTKSIWLDDLSALLGLHMLKSLLK